MKPFIIIVITLITTFLSANRFDNMDIIFINGIQNEKIRHAIPSAIELSKAIGQPDSRVKAVYNKTDGFFEDIAAVYAEGYMDATNGGKDFTKFWQLVNGDFSTANRRGYGNNEPMPEHLKQWYINQIIDGFIKYQGDYQKVYKKIREIRASNPKPNKKLLILSHSEGTIIANLVMKQLLEEYGDEAKHCTRLVSIATPVSSLVGIRNGGKYVTSNQDKVINGIRYDMSSLRHNITTNFDPVNDFMGHGLREIYLNRGTHDYHNNTHENIRNKIIADINAMADEINEKCVTYSVEAIANYSTWVFIGMEDQDTAHVGFTVKQKKNGTVYKTINLSRILTFRYDTGENYHYDSAELEDVEHYHISCSSGVSGLCTYLRRKVGSTYSRGAGSTSWTIHVLTFRSFISRIKSALRAKYKPR